MAKRFSGLEVNHREFIEKQRLFFTATAAKDTRVNVSPRSTDWFRVLDSNCIAYLDRTGSGNETAAHLGADGRLTIMFCAFDGPPMILRLYGQGEVYHREGQAFADLLASEFGGEAPLGTRQIIRQKIDLVQTSCGFGVPLYDYAGERLSLDR